MKRVVVTGVLIALLGTAGYGQDPLSQLGITPLAARVAVNTVLSSGLNNPGLPAKAFNLLAPAARGQLATAGMAWLKNYVASPEFATQYAQVRDSHKPQPPQFAGTPEDEIKKADEEQKQQAAESRKAIASLPAEQRAQLEESLMAMLTQMNTPEMRKVRLDTVIADRAERTARYREALANWTRDFPERPAPLIAKRLREFLAVSADIDFTATLTPRNGKLIFENADYEQKPAQWKMCYRAGKEATTAARGAAQAWLKELGG
jgi:hypothetical protein